jgi:hypothetical protein
MNPDLKTINLGKLCKVTRAIRKDKHHFWAELPFLFKLAIINSSWAKYYLRRHTSTPILVKDWKNLPIADIPDEAKIPYIKLVEYIIYLTPILKDVPNQGENLRYTCEDKLMLSYFRQILDALVLELYEPVHLHHGDKYFLKHLPRPTSLLWLKDLKGREMDGLKLIFKKLFHRDHPVRRNIYFLNCLAFVREVRGERWVKVSPTQYSFESMYYLNVPIEEDFNEYVYRFWDGIAFYLDNPNCEFKDKANPFAQGFNAQKIKTEQIKIIYPKP